MFLAAFHHISLSATVDEMLMVVLWLKSLENTSMFYLL